MGSRRSFLLVCTLAGLAGTVLAPSLSRSPALAQPAASAFPMRMLTGEGDGPALYLSASAGAPAIGYVSPDVEIEVAEPPSGNRVLVRIRGAMRVRAYMDATRLAARIQRRGRLRGTPAYLAGGDRVRVLGFEPEGRVRVSARVVVGTRTLDYVGTFPAVGLGSAAPAQSAETVPPGERAVIRAAQPVVLRDGTSGSEIATLPAGLIPCRLVQRLENGWSVLIGTGPYVAGVVDVEPVDSDLADIGPTSDFHTGHVLPGRLSVDTQLRLVRIATGTRVSFDDQTVAVLDEPGMARIVERYDASGEADAYVAVDDRVAVRGMIPLAAITAEAPNP